MGARAWAGLKEETDDAVYLRLYDELHAKFGADLEAGLPFDAASTPVQLLQLDHHPPRPYLKQP